MLKSLPVIVYHHVNSLGEDITELEFDAHMSYFSSQGYRTIFLKDWIRGNITPDSKTIALTFDDGFLDNWVYAYPILKKYGLKATIFVSTARALNSEPPRLNLDDLWEGRCTRQELPPIVSDWEANRRCVLREEGSDDFLNWKEMREMEASGHIDIQSHSHFHRDFFVSNQIVDFNRNAYFGVGWATDGDTRYGIPIYPRKSAMMARRYFDDPGLRDHLAERVGGANYSNDVSKAKYMSELLKVVSDYKNLNRLDDYFESKQEQENRILSELSLSKKLIEEQLEKSCDLICWPWGEYSDLSISLAIQAGYKGSVTFTPGVNLTGTKAGIWQIKRFSPARNIEDYQRSLSAFSSPARAMFLGWKTKAKSTMTKIISRAREGQLKSAVRRKLFGLLTQS